MPSRVIISLSFLLILVMLGDGESFSGAARDNGYSSVVSWMWYILVEIFYKGESLGVTNGSDKKSIRRKEYFG